MKHRDLGFNPSVGILLVWTKSLSTLLCVGLQFQSLGRDSVGLDKVGWPLMYQTDLFQSLGRDSVGLDPQETNAMERVEEVSIPRSGFCWFGPEKRVACSSPRIRFNPSVGILLVWTRWTIRAWVVFVAVSIPRSGFCWFGPIGAVTGCTTSMVFQSLGRDSVGLDEEIIELLVASDVVSIPRSGFCWFGPSCLFMRNMLIMCFNPSVGILLVWTGC